MGWWQMKALLRRSCVLLKTRESSDAASVVSLRDTVFELFAQLCAVTTWPTTASASSQHAVYSSWQRLWSSWFSSDEVSRVRRRPGRGSSDASSC